MSIVENQRWMAVIASGEGVPNIVAVGNINSTKKKGCFPESFGGRRFSICDIDNDIVLNSTCGNFRGKFWDFSL